MIRCLPLLLLLLLAPSPAPAQEAPATHPLPATDMSKVPATDAATDSATVSVPAEEIKEEKKEEPKVWSFSASDGKKQGPVSISELRELMKIKVVDGGTPLLRDGQKQWTYPGHVPELQGLVKWHFMLREKKTGPVDTARLGKLLDLKVITLESTVWRPGMEGWKAAAELPELQALLDPEALAAWKKQAEEKDPGEGEEELDERFGRFFVSFGGHVGANALSRVEGMAMLGGGARVSMFHVFRPEVHVGVHITYTRIEARGQSEEVFKLVEGINDFAFGATVQLGKQFSDRLWVGFGLDLGASAIRRADLVRGKDTHGNEITVSMDISPHLYAAPRAQLIYFLTHKNSRLGVMASLSVPVMMAQVDYNHSYTPDKGPLDIQDFDELSVWSGIFLNLEFLLGIR